VTGLALRKLLTLSIASRNIKAPSNSYYKLNSMAETVGMATGGKKFINKSKM